MKRILRALGYSLWLCLMVMAQSPEVQTRILTAGNGPEVKLGDNVAISYVLKLADGTIIEATPANTSFKMEVGSKKLIPGLSLGLIGMRRGEVREIVIPPVLGYGSRPVGPIPADSTLYFRVDLNYLVTSTSDDLAERFGKDGFENRPDARNLDKPAMFEYLIRDFFTRPWRYEDSAQITWRANLGMTLLALLIAGATQLALKLRGGPR